MPADQANSRFAGNGILNFIRSNLPSLQAESDELLHLDLLRIIAATSIVVYHFRNQWTFGLNGSNIHQFENMSLGVDLFLVISGIVISYVYLYRIQQGGVGEFVLFMRRRFARLAPLYYLTLLFYLSLGFVGLLGSDAWKYRPDCLLSNLLFLQAFRTCDTYSFNHVSWSISAEMLAYVLFPLAALLVAKGRWTLPVLSIATLAALWGIDFQAGNVKPWHALTFDGGAVRAIPGFLIGVTTFIYRDQLRELPRPRLLLLVAALGFFAGLILSVDRGILLIDVYLIALFAFASDLQGNATAMVRRIAPLGAITYGVYMLHPLVRTVGMPFGKALGLNVNAIVIIDFIVLFPAAYLSYIFIEMPLRRMLAPCRRTPATL